MSTSPAAPKRPKLIRHVRPDGSVVVYAYDRTTGAKLSATEVEAAQRAAAPPPACAMHLRRPPEGPHALLSDVVRAWEHSIQYGELAAATRRNYTWCIGHPAVRPLLNLPCSAITKKSLRALRDGVAQNGLQTKGRPTKALANNLLNVLCSCFAWGIEHCDLENNPVAGLKRLPTQGGHQPWPDEAVAEWLDRGPEWARRVIHVGLWTALRSADLIALRWDQWDGAAFRHRARKTYRHASTPELYIPLSPEANALLGRWRAEASTLAVPTLTVLAQPGGLPWTSSNYLALALARARETHGLPGGTPHGLRVTAATRLIEAGLPSRDVMALTGHTQESTFAKYVRHADQRQRAERAAAVWARITPLRGGAEQA